jgi:hypothetical protein
VTEDLIGTDGVGGEPIQVSQKRLLQGHGMRGKPVGVDGVLNGRMQLHQLRQQRWVPGDTVSTDRVGRRAMQLTCIADLPSLMSHLQRKGHGEHGNPAGADGVHRGQ